MARIFGLYSPGSELPGLYFHNVDLVHGYHKTTMIHYHEKNCMKGSVDTYINYAD
jgi:hypothetical protein